MDDKGQKLFMLIRLLVLPPPPSFRKSMYATGYVRLWITGVCYRNSSSFFPHIKSEVHCKALSSMRKRPPGSEAI